MVARSGHGERLPVRQADGLPAFGAGGSPSITRNEDLRAEVPDFSVEWQMPESPQDRRRRPRHAATDRPEDAGRVGSGLTSRRGG
jgi:hypothetical protein